MRCPLLVPCDADDRALAAALAAGADALVLDLSGAPAGPGRDAARRRAARFLAEARGTGPERVLRVAALGSGLVDGDLDAVLAAPPDAVLLPGAVGGRDIQHIGAKLAVREAGAGLPPGRIRVLALVGDTARGALTLHTVPGASARLAGVGWDPDALAAEVGVDHDAAPCRAARGLVLLAAAAAGVPAFEAPSGPPSRDLAGDCRTARRDGFAGRLARHPDEVATVLACFAGPARC